MRSLKIASIVAIALSLFTFSHAQTLPGISNPLVVTVIPAAPRANEPVSISIQSYSLDLDRSLVTWLVDGKEVSSGVGERSFVFQAGELGSMNIVTIEVTAPGSGIFKETVIIRPANVALVWEADTYTPPFYKGKALHSYNGAFRVTAIPELYATRTTKLGPNELVYTWKKNGEVQASASGYGKSSFVTSQTSYLREGENISVEVSAPADNLLATASITVTPTVPKIIFYEESPLYGTIFEKSLLGRTVLENEEITVSAEPYFFSARNRTDNTLGYSWSLDGGRLIDFDGQPFVTLRKSGGSGSADLSLVMQSAARVLQGARADLTIDYDE